MGYMSICLYLLQHGSCPNTTTVRGETALHLAARANQSDIIRILLRNGATVDARARVRIDQLIKPRLKAGHYPTSTRWRQTNEQTEGQRHPLTL